MACFEVTLRDRTVEEVGGADAYQQEGPMTTFFRLGEDPGLARFIEQMADRVEGRVVAPELDALGAAVVGSYLGSRGPGGGGGSARTPDGRAARALRHRAIINCMRNAILVMKPQGERFSQRCSLPRARKAR